MRFAIKLQKSFGSWEGLNIIAIGPMGGKIVGYGSDGKPYYAGSKKAEALAGLKQNKHVSAQSAKGMDDATGEWLLALGIPSVIDGDDVAVSPDSAEMISQHFHAQPTHVTATTKHFSLKGLFSHVGEPFKPPTDEQQAMFAAEAASGQFDHDPFPELSSLTQIDAGKFAGSHKNLLFTDKSGKKWIFKGADPTIARAEEAASRIGKLIMGDKIPPAKFVKVGNKSGTLIGEIAGTPLNESNHNAPPKAMLQKHFDDVAQHAVVDWLTSNHDGHAGNFLVAGDSLNAIDKGQAWKFFGKDKLDPDYKPNPSKTIYNTFWNAISDGSIKGDVVAAVTKAVEAAEKITPEQFDAIVKPYITTGAGHFGWNADARAKAMAARLANLRSDWEGFLSQVLGHPVTLPKKGENNFETMPESTPGPKPEEPVEQPKPVESQPPVVTKPAPGWPITKGKITIAHPGNAAPANVEWPSKYPGPGFKAKTNYKGGDYQVSFHVNGGEMLVNVVYPDGSVHSFDSPNQASDSLYLFHNKLPLTMNATEKKKQGISLPAATAFGLKAFADELAAAKGQTVPESPTAMTVAELEKEKIVEPTQQAMLATTENEPAPAPVATIEPTPEPGPPPPATLPDTAQVPLKSGAGTGPLPAGTAITVKKKDLGDVTLIESDGKFVVSGLAFETEVSFDSLSSASDHVWVNQKGYKDVAAYKAATGKVKVPSGGGWKFWGVTAQGPAPEPAVVPETLALPPEVAAAANAPPPYASMEHLDSLPSGTKAILSQNGHVTKMTKSPAGYWQDDKGAVFHEAILSDIATNPNNSISFFPSTVDTSLISPLPPAIEEEAPAHEGSLLIPATMDKDKLKSLLDKFDEGTIVKLGGASFQKTGDLEWTQMTALNGASSPDSLTTGILAITLKTMSKIEPAHSLIAEDPPGSAPNNFATMPDSKPKIGVNKDVIYGAEVGTKLVDPAGTVWGLESDGKWHSPSLPSPMSDEDLSDYYKLTLLGKQKAEPAAAKLVKPGKTHTDEEGLPSAVAVKLSAPMTQAQEWSKDTLGAKPATWPDWVPPPGVTIEGTHNGKKYFALVAVAGHNPDGSPGQVKFAILNEAGDVSTSDKVPASKAKAAFTKLVGSAVDGEVTASQALEAFGLHKAVFPPGSTILSVAGTASPVTVAPKPEKKPKKVPETTTTNYSATAAAKMDFAKDPIGTTYAVGSHGFKKVSADKWAITNPAPDWALKDAWDNGHMDDAFHMIMKPGGGFVKTTPKKGENNFETMPESAKPVVSAKPVKSEQQIAKEKIAAETQTWAQLHPAITNAGHLDALGKIQDVFGLFSTSKKMWARATPDGKILLGSPHTGQDGIVDFAKSNFGGEPYTVVDTPIGQFVSISPESLMKIGKAGEPVTGPDGKVYPAGTTFTTKTTEYKVEQLLAKEDGFYKIKPHETDKTMAVLKINGSGATQIEQMKAMLAKYNVPSPQATHPVVGKSNVLAFVKKDDLAKVAKTETTTTPNIPSGSEPFISAAIPHLGNTKDGQIVSSNRSDIAVLDTIKLGKFGHSIRMGAAGVLTNQQMSVRKVRDASGKLFYEFSGQLAKFKMPSGAPTGTFPLRSAMTNFVHAYDPETGVHQENGAAIIHASGLDTATDSGSTVRVITDEPSLKNVFLVRVPVGADAEAELASAFEKMGVKDAMAHPTEEDERLYIKAQIVRSMLGAKGYKGLTGSQRADEKFLDQQLAEFGMTDAVKSATVQTVFDGKHGVVLDDADKFKDMPFVYQGQSSWEGAFYQIKDGMGWSGRANRYLNGVQNSGASASEDMGSGGGIGCFSRPAIPSLDGSGWGLRCAGTKIIFHPRVFQRADWYGYSTDSYGNTAGTGSGAPYYKSLGDRGRYKAFNNADSSAEIIHENGLSLHDAAGVMVTSEGEKEKLVKALTAEGITEVNTIPLDKFIVVHSGNSRTELAAKVEGLKPGVLP